MPPLTSRSFARWIFDSNFFSSSSQSRCAGASGRDSGSGCSRAHHLSRSRSWQCRPVGCFDLRFVAQSFLLHRWEKPSVTLRVLYAMRYIESISAVYFVNKNTVLIYVHANVAPRGFAGMLICFPAGGEHGDAHLLSVS